MTTLFERVRGIAADILSLPGEQITLESSAHTIESWDSVQHLNLVLALEQEFGLQFEPEEIERMNAIRQILVVLQSKLNGGS